MSSSSSHVSDRKLTFKEIMDEELAKKYQRDYEAEIANLVKPSQEEEDFLLAIKLSQESMISDMESTVEAPPPPLVEEEENAQLTEDFLLAIQLQEQMNEQEREYHQRLQQQNQGSNIQITTHYGRLFEEDPIPIPIPSLGDEPSFEEEDEEYGDYHPSIKAWNKPNGRTQSESPKKKEIRTKHDPVLCGARNTELLESQISINCGNIVRDNIQLPNPVFNAVNQYAVKEESKRVRKHGKEDRETREGVMDPRTRLILYKMINKGLLKEMIGIINSGKEANVYHAIAGEGETMYAVKIFKTTLNEFKNRDEYIKDDYRFRYRYNKQSSRKFIRVWAQKEQENLNRLQRYAIPCPTVVACKENILVLSFLGVGHTAAPQLRNAKGLSGEKKFELYVQCVRAMRVMFQDANLIHADLSEYNLLYHQGKLWFIDVSQAVEHEHPNALYFLRRDCENITKYFTKFAASYGLLTTRELFNYITDVHIQKINEQQYLEAALERCLERNDLSLEEQLEENIFLESHIPRHLSDIDDPFAETTGDEYHKTLSGLPKGEEEDFPEDLDIVVPKKIWVERQSKEQAKADKKEARKFQKKQMKELKQQHLKQTDPY